MQVLRAVNECELCAFEVRGVTSTEDQAAVCEYGVCESGSCSS